MNMIETVDAALDKYVDSMKDRGIDPSGFATKTLAQFAKMPVGQMSQWLQVYRREQDGVSTRYVIACREYGRNARWRILSKPGSHARTVRRARVEQAQWVTTDAFARLSSDVEHEVRAALGNTADDAFVDRVIGFALTQVEATRDFVVAELETIAI